MRDLFMYMNANHLRKIPHEILWERYTRRCISNPKSITGNIKNTIDMETFTKVAEINSIKTIFNPKTEKLSLLLNCTDVHGESFIASTAKEWLTEQDVVNASTDWGIRDGDVVQLTLEQSVANTTKYTVEGKDGKPKEYTHTADRLSVVGIQHASSKHFAKLQSANIMVNAISNAPESVREALAVALGTAMTSVVAGN